MIFLKEAILYIPIPMTLLHIIPYLSLKYTHRKSRLDDAECLASDFAIFLSEVKETRCPLVSQRIHFSTCQLNRRTEAVVITPSYKSGDPASNPDLGNQCRAHPDVQYSLASSSIN